MKKILLPLLLVIVMVLGIFGIIYFNRIKIKTYENELYSFKYDSTWKLERDDFNVLLVHKKSKATLNIKYRELENYFIDIQLKDIVNELVDGIIEQNDGYSLISFGGIVSNEMEGYSYLYEKDNEQALVNIYKKDKNLIIIYYVCKSNYFDIVLDSVDYMLSSFQMNQK